ncbi:MAG: branched-chain amino acid ABC transporter permease [Methanocella sp.]
MHVQNALKKFGPIAVGAAALLALPLVLEQYAIHILVLTGIYIILSVGLSLVSGFAGQLSLGQAAFYAVGAYTAALLAVNFGAPFWVGAIAATIMAALVGILLGLPTLRLSGVYLTVATVGFGEIVRMILMNWVSLTRGPMGIRGIPPAAFGSLVLAAPAQFYYLVVFSAALALFIAYRIIHSRVGRAFVAIADKEIAAQTVGINPTFYKTLAFVLSAAFAGFAGSLYAHYIGYLHPDAFTQAESVLAVTIIVIGGVRSLGGIVGAALILVPAMEYLRAFSEYRLIVYAALLILSLIFMPDGIGGVTQWLLDRRKARRLAATGR